MSDLLIYDKRLVLVILPRPQLAGTVQFFPILQFVGHFELPNIIYTSQLARSDKGDDRSGSQA
jgi:hypothetical protein